MIAGSNFRVEPRRRFVFRARGETVQSTLWIEIEGSRDECTVLRNRVADLINTKRAWFSVLYPKSPWGNGLLTAVAFFSVAAVTLWVLHKQGDEVSKMSQTLAWLTIPVVFVLGWLRKQIFPRMVVDIGRSAAVGVRAAYFRNMLLVGVLLTLAVRGLGSIAGNFFLN